MLLGKWSLDIVWTFCKVLYIFPIFYVLDLECFHLISNALHFRKTSLLMGNQEPYLWSWALISLLNCDAVAF